MGTFFAYTIKGSIILLMGYFAYKLLLANENQARLNRFTILLILLMSFILPLFDLMPIGQAAFKDILSIGNPYAEISNTIERDSTFNNVVDFRIIFISTYIIGASITLVSFVIASIRLVIILHTAKYRSIGKYKLAIIDKHNGIAPFSTMRYISMTKDDFENFGDIVVAHETAHLRYLHWVDLLIAHIACVVFWYNPASWLIREELRNVHEYQADESVITSGIDAQYYQMALIKMAVGKKISSLANGLNNNKLKKRVIMMINSKTSTARRFRAIAVLPVILLAITVINSPALANALSAISENKAAVPVYTASYSTTPDAMAKDANTSAQFPGGEQELMKFLMNNVRYPAEAIKNYSQGVVVVQFDIEEDGSVRNVLVKQSVSKELDAAVVSAVKKMPKWNPATVNGKVAKSTISLPFTFKTH